MTYAAVTIQITPESKPAMPTFLGEVAAFAQVLTHTGMLKTIQRNYWLANRFLPLAAWLTGRVQTGS